VDKLHSAGTIGREGVMAGELYHQAEITSVYPLTRDEKLYQVQIVDPDARHNFAFKAGQFVMLELPGIGEAPFSISSAPSRRGDLELCIRAVGNLTRFLDRVERGTRVGISGPYGSSFPVEAMAGRDVIFVAGGLVLVPLRSPLAVVLENRSRYGLVDLVYGAKSPAELLFDYQYRSWQQFDVNLGITVDNPDAEWQGDTGLITGLLERQLNGRSLAHHTSAVVCGPPVMFKYVCDLLIKAGMPRQRIFVSLERRMHCGRGKCCRCNIGSTYTCKQGPVFDYWTVMNLKEAI